MATVYAFPTKRKLPGGMEKEIHRVAKHYVEALYAITTLFALEEDKPTQEEIMELVANAFTDGIFNAIEELDES